ncbi:acetylserotonin O-methyltransferase [Sciurus carolinensis]|uniref:acetylserotonin O-methyltransferase n=1 Tax=Sciurus carolinensis TaxID=30640 RepID=UPI001FB2A086|nr:acetylserotonin O-methyltransferase [Sciurus carolinensis]
MGSPQDGAYLLLSQHASGFMVSQVLFAACELGVFDLLAETPGPLDAAAIAEGLGTSFQGTERLLEACVPLQLLDVDTRGGRAVYRNSGLASAFLTRRGPRSQRHMLLYLGRTTYHCWAHLAEAVRQGGNQYPRAFGVAAGDLWAAIYRSPGERRQFTRGLQEVWSVEGRAVLTAFDLSAFPRICDLGGDFFQDPLPEADLYILARVLHDWAEDKCSQLLARVHQACRPGGGVLVVESLLDEDRRGPLTTLLFSLNMLVQAEGQERTPSQYRRLLAAAGFPRFRFQKTGGTYDAVLAGK